MPNLCITCTVTFLRTSFYLLLLLLVTVAARSLHGADLIYGDAGVEMYLRRYGWLAPVVWDKMPTEPAITSTFDLQRLNLPEIIEGGETSRTFKWKHQRLQTTVSTKTTDQPTIREDLVPALQRFQQANSIPVTGRLDSETLYFLNSPRCGVPDRLLGLTTQEEDEEDGNTVVVDEGPLHGIGEVEATHSDDGPLDGIGEIEATPSDDRPLDGISEVEATPSDDGPLDVIGEVEATPSDDGPLDGIGEVEATPSDDGPLDGIGEVEATHSDDGLGDGIGEVEATPSDDGPLNGIGEVEATPSDDGPLDGIGEVEATPSDDGPLDGIGEVEATPSDDGPLDGIGEVEATPSDDGPLDGIGEVEATPSDDGPLNGIGEVEATPSDDGPLDGIGEVEATPSDDGPLDGIGEVEATPSDDGPLNGIGEVEATPSDDGPLDGIGEVEATPSDDGPLDGISNGDYGALVRDGEDHRAESKVKIKNNIQGNVITSSDELVLSNPEFSRDAAFNETSETLKPNTTNTIFHQMLSLESNITHIVVVEEGRNQTDEPMMRQNYTWGQPGQNYSKDNSSYMQKANYSEENSKWENDKTTYTPTMNNLKTTTQPQSFADFTQTKQSREDLHHSTSGKLRRDVEQSNLGQISLRRKLRWLQEKPVRTRRTLQKINEEQELNTNVMQGAGRKRTKRALVGHRSGGQVVFGRRPLRWRLIGEGYSSQLSIGEQRQVLMLAFRMWSEVAPVEFQEDLVSPPGFVDIKLGFGTGRHLGCVRTFDGFGHELAHAWRLGDVHFDDDENFSLPNSPRGINLLKVAVHEIGHVLGLQHMMRRNSVMQPRYLPHNGAFELDAIDRKHVQHMYGICNSPFDTIFDWVRSERRPNGRTVIFFNTYIFRHSWYWMYDNRKGRPRHGDPLPISAGWPGLPISQIDGFAHVWMGSQDRTYFFKGAYYWRYDNNRDQVYSVDPEGVTYPRLIPEEFPGVPYPIDTVYFDNEDRHLYFFKENNVTAFDIYKRRPVPGHPIPLVSLFLPVRPGDHPIGGLDAAYYSYSLGSLFLLKNSRVWQVVPSRHHRAVPKIPLRDLLPGRSVSDAWKDVCDVHISMLNMA
uniref:matrix metalloproteinase-21 n=1 Tax=Myxine glutinosa TaxID=7769 RepID=UPI00358E6322